MKGSLVHMLYHIQSIGKIPLEQFKDVIPNFQYKKTLIKKMDAWYSLTRDVMIDYLYSVRLFSLHFILKLNICI
jgi:hypothetical protein